ncbi:MAG: hypothetical protein JWM80_621 [Cyanobacteria bacterium RYN_339]|nr:hypothetical protein [Cyanobacteria bacterium RYN_339]
MPTLHDELHQLIDDLPDDHASALLGYANYLQARQHDLAITFWPDRPIADWDDDPTDLLDLAPAYLR